MYPVFLTQRYTVTLAGVTAQIVEIATQGNSMSVKSVMHIGGSNPILNSTTVVCTDGDTSSAPLTISIIRKSNFISC